MRVTKRKRAERLKVYDTTQMTVVVFTLRLREKLRGRLEREAKKHHTSMNDEIIRRLEESLRGEDLAKVIKATIKSTMDLRQAPTVLRGEDLAKVIKATVKSMDLRQAPTVRSKGVETEHRTVRSGG